MSTWILVLTIWSYQSKAIDHINGFKTEAACMEAGGKWLTQQTKKATVLTEISAVCLEQKQ